MKFNTTQPWDCASAGLIAALAAFSLSAVAAVALGPESSLRSRSPRWRSCGRESW